MLEHSWGREAGRETSQGSHSCDPCWKVCMGGYRVRTGSGLRCDMLEWLANSHDLGSQMATWARYWCSTSARGTVTLREPLPSGEREESCRKKEMLLIFCKRPSLKIRPLLHLWHISLISDQSHSCSGDHLAEDIYLILFKVMIYALFGGFGVKSLPL